MSPPRILIYLLRRDLRLADNPILHELSRLISGPRDLLSPPFTHLLPLYVFSAQQVEVSGFLSAPSASAPSTSSAAAAEHSGESGAKSPYPEARSAVGGFWRCGPHRARWVAESVWDVKGSLEEVGSGLEVRVGMVGDVVGDLMRGYGAGGVREADAGGSKEEKGEVVGVWMTGEEGVEEKREERDVRRVVEGYGKECRIWRDEKYFVDDRDLPFKNPQDLPDVFTAFRKMVEPLREAPRKPLPRPSTLPPLPPFMPPQSAPFSIPTSLDATIAALLKPLDPSLDLLHPPQFPTNAASAHPFHGGESTGHARLAHLIRSGAATAYKDTRNGLLGPDFSTKFSTWLALGSLTARQIHAALLAFEHALTPLGSSNPGYGRGESAGTAAIRFELLWRDYMRLCTRKFGARLFALAGFRSSTSSSSRSSTTSANYWKSPSRDPAVQSTLQRLLAGTTGTGLIDASQRELFLTGYTSNRARQNVASFLAKHLHLDWRLGAEWYESLLVDYDVSSNWGNWQYVAGVGNDPRGEDRVFNPVKQSWDYDPRGEYVRMWVSEVRGVRGVEGVFQGWRVGGEERVREGLVGNEGVERPLIRIEWRGGGKAGRGGGRGGGGGGRGGRNELPYRSRGGGGGERGGRGQGRGGRGQKRLGREDKAQVAQYGGPEE